MALGATALRPAATATARTTAKARAVAARADHGAFDATAQRGSFDHGFGAQTSGLDRGTHALGPRRRRTRGYAPDYAAPTNTGGPPPPPTVEWDVRNVNSVVVIGNVGMTPEITEFGNGACVARCSSPSAVRNAWTTRWDSHAMGAQEYDAQTTWLDVEAWNDEARQLVEHVAARGGRSKSRASQGEHLDRQGDGTEAQPHQGERVRVRVRRAVRRPGAYAARRTLRQSSRRATTTRSRRRLRRSHKMSRRRRRTARPPPPPLPEAAGGEKDDLWRDCVNNPDAWWDNRARKAEPGATPDTRISSTRSRKRRCGSSRETRRNGPSTRSKATAERARRRARRWPPSMMGSIPTTPIRATRTTLETRCRRDPGPAPRMSPTTRSRTRPSVAYEPAKPFPDDDEPPF